MVDSARWRAGPRARLEALKSAWPQLSERLRAHLWRAPLMETRLRAAGAPVLPEDIGISAARLRETVGKARYIRSRYTILDLLAETGLLDDALDATVGPRA